MIVLALAVEALLLPLCLFAQLTRALPLLFAAAPAWGATLSLLASALGLLALALAPPALCVASSVASAELVACGAVRALRTHGAGEGWLAAQLAPMAAVVALGIGSSGVWAEPELAWNARRNLSSLAARAVLGTLARGGQLEPTEGVVIAAPSGARGGLHVAVVRDHATTLLRADGFALTVDRSLTLSMRGVTVEAQGARATAARVTWTVPLAGPDGTLVSAELVERVGHGGAAAHRRHAARVLWGALAAVAVMLPARVSIAPRLGAMWRAAVAGVVTLGVMTVIARVHQAWVATLAGREAIAGAAACGALVAVLVCALAAARR